MIEQRAQPVQFTNYAAPGFPMMQRDSVPQNYQYSATIGYGYGAPTNISEGAFIKSHAAPPAPRSRSGRDDVRTSESSSSASRSAGSSSEPQQPQSQGGALISFSDVEEEMPITKLRGLAERWALSDGFNPDQMTEFGHLMSMVTSTYIPKTKLTRMSELDSGSFGKIYQTTYDGCDVAVKQISNTSGSSIKAKMRELLLELRVLVRVRHPNVVTFWGTATDFPEENDGRQAYLGLVFELCPRGSLHTALFEDKKGRKLSVAERLRIAHGTAQGISYLHNKRVIHRDINPRNVLLMADLTPKIADFGCARVLSSQARELKTTTISGSPAYMAPEQIKGDDLTFACDTWSMGVMLWEIMMGQKPWEGRFVDFESLKRAIVQGERLRLPSSTPFPPDYCKCIHLCMHMKADKRPSMAVVAAELKRAIK